MCRNIRPLFNFDPPATPQELEDAARQFVRKISGFRQPSAANVAAFEQAVQEIAAAATTLVSSLVTQAPAKDRAVQAQRLRERSRRRFARP